MRVLAWNHLHRLKGPLRDLSSISPFLEVAIKVAAVLPPAAPVLVTSGDLSLGWQALEVRTTSLGKVGRCA